MIRSPCVSIVLALLVMTAARLDAQQIRGRVVDDRSRQPVRNASVVLADTAGTVLTAATTGTDGFFELRAPGPGKYAIAIQQPGFAGNRREVVVRDADLLVPAFVLVAQAIPLDSIDVQTRARRDAVAPPVGFQRSSHIVAGERLATLEAHGARMLTAVKEISSIRTREWNAEGRNYFCVQSVRTAASGLQIGGRSSALGRNANPDCPWVAIVIDGILIGGDPMQNFRQLYVSNFESIEYLPPAEAGRQYGMEAASSGALVLWTRGRGPHVNPSRNR